MKPPRIEAVEVTGPTQSRIAWTTGERLEVDLAGPVNRLKALAPLRDPAAFGGVQVGEWGHSLVWDGEIDLGADRLYEHCRQRVLPLAQVREACVYEEVSGWPVRLS